MSSPIVPFSVGVQFGGMSKPPLGPTCVKITQQEFSHDVLSLTFWADDVDGDSYTTGMPMSMNWGRQGTTRRQFYGYVNHPARTTNMLSNNTSLSQRNSTQIVCVGASWPMKETSTQAFYNMTAPQVVQQIATQFNLAADVVPHPTVWPVLNMAGLTFWQFCCELAHKIGYTFYCNGVELKFRPRRTDPKDQALIVAVYDGKASPFNMPVFTPVLGANSPVGGQLRNRVHSTVDPRTLQVVTSVQSGSPAPIYGKNVDTPPFTKIEHFTAGTVQESAAKVQGQGLANQLYITCEATAVGNPFISQGSVIYVQNLNGSQNGLWFVTKAVHEITMTNYTLSLCLGRDSTGSTASFSISPNYAALPQGKLSGQATWVAAA